MSTPNTGNCIERKVSPEDRKRFWEECGFEEQLFFRKLGKVFGAKLISVKFKGE